MRDVLRDVIHYVMHHVMHHVMHRAMQVWKKTLQPSPQISVCGGGVNQGVGVPHTARVELEVHACLLHVATGQLVPEALAGHLKPLEASSLGNELTVRFNELTVRAHGRSRPACL